MSLWECVEHGTEASNVTMVLHVDEHVKVYRNYLNVLCDVISISGFMQIAKLVDISPKLVTFFSERCHVKKNRKSHEVIVSLALSSPLTRLSVYKFMIQSLLRSNANSDQSQTSKQIVQKKLHDALAKWELIYDEQEKRKREAETTRQFWESSGRLMELLRAPNRRLIRESRTYPISVYSSGRFSSHWLVLLSDVLVHVVGSSCTTHPLSTVWVEPLQDTDTMQNALTLTMPEESLTLHTPTANDKKEWIHCLQNYIKKSLQKSFGHQPPVIRTATYTFTKHLLYKDAKYIGRWCSGKLQGAGKMLWPDGKVYIGQFQNNMMHGYGCLETPGISTYEGQWKEGQQNGLGFIKYAGGDIYEGYFKDGQPHGHGVRKQGHFMASVASVYIGEWVAGVKQGYGVMDDIVTGEKYLGCWSNNMKHGCGLIVTLDGIYYEGVFMQDVLTDGTHYEGEFRSVGVFSGKGTLTFNSGDRLEGTLYGAWNEGVKVTGTLHKITSDQESKPQSFGKLCVAAHQKWKAIFRQCYAQLGVTGISETVAAKTGTGSPRPNVDLQKIWENVAVLITSSRQEALRRSRSGLINEESTNDSLDTIPQFASEKLTKETYKELRKYLGKLCSITGRMYEVVRLLFPSLPELGQGLKLEDDEDGDEKRGLVLSNCEYVSAAALLHPVLLPRVHSALFVLYALHHKQEDDAYWKRLLKWNKQPDSTLMAFLGVDQKFWIKYSSPKNVGCVESLRALSPLHEQMFHDAVETLQQLKTTFSPMEKLLVIRSTLEQMTRAVQLVLGTDYLWSMDDLIPVFLFVIVRSQILQLGSEIHFIEDFMEPYFQNGELGIMFTTLKACYNQILLEKVSMSS
ncbi:Alsin homolog [Gryllus bimaculatus]|nr:Alsin homolog [Gryllus bimaculatus]